MKISTTIYSAVVHKEKKVISALKKIGFKDSEIEVKAKNVIDIELTLTVNNQDPESIFALGVFIGQLLYS